MKTFNLIACIIVLVLALISAACSYFLYEKRVQFVDGWNKMSTAINTSAKTIDSRGEKKFAPKLTTDTLSHKNYAALDANLKNLTDQSTAFVKQYDELVAERDNLKETLAKTEAELKRVKNQRQQMAATFAAISDKIGANAGSAANFADINIYSGRIKLLKDKISQIFDNRAKIASVLQDIAKKEQFTVDKQKLYNNPSNALSPLSAKFTELKRARNNYASSLRNIATLVSVKFTDNGLAASSVITGVKGKLNDLKKANDQIKADKNQIGALQAVASKLNTKIRDLNGVIANLRLALNLPAKEKEPKVWKRGSQEARSALLGKVIEVSKEFGYIVIDFGTDTFVKQTFGDKELQINPDVETGLSFNVVREGQFIAEITLHHVGAKESTASIPVKAADEIKVGDFVILNK